MYYGVRGWDAHIFDNLTIGQLDDLWTGHMHTGSIIRILDGARPVSTIYHQES